MSTWTRTAYAAVTLTAIACATLQPSHATAVEQNVKCLMAQAWSDGADLPAAAACER